MKRTKKIMSGLLLILCLCLHAGAVGITGAAAGLWMITACAADKPVETVYLGDTKHVGWETDTVGKWSSVKQAHEYQVKLFISDYVDRDEENWREVNLEDEELETVVTIRTSECSWDFSEYMDDLHTYFFAVMAVPKISEQVWVVPGNWIASPDIDFKEKAVIGITEGTWRNYLEGSRYEDGEGNFLPAGWHLIRGDWYLLDEGGYRLTGWQEENGSRYYLSEDGRMATGWFVYEDSWYYANASGQIQTGRVMDEPGEYYDLDETGKLIDKEK